MNRVGIRVQDLFDESILRQKVDGALGLEEPGARRRSTTAARSTVDEVVEELLSYVDRLRPLVGDTALVLSQALDDGKVVLSRPARPPCSTSTTAPTRS